MTEIRASELASLSVPGDAALADRVRSLGGTSAADVLVAARALEAAGRHVVHLEVGEPDAPTPPHVVEAAVQALREGRTRYAPPSGIPELRTAIAESVRRRGVVAEPVQVVVTPGAKAMIFSTLLAVVRPGDEVLVPDPGYPVYGAVAEFAGGRAVRYSLDAGRGFGIDAEDIAARVTPRTRLLVVNAPHNPTGGVIAPETLERIAELARRHDLLVVSDEIYGRHVYGENSGSAHHPSIASLPEMQERTVVVDGFSKTYAMTGWRLGYGVLPRGLVKAVTAVVTNSATCTATFVQHAGVAALSGPQDSVVSQREALRVRRDQLVAALNRIDGVRCGLPAGAFYAFPSIAALLEGGGIDAAAFARRLLEQFGVAAMPGSAFGPGGAGHLRLSYAASPADLATAAERLAACAASVAGGRG